MTRALGIAQGGFGRVALLDMDKSLVGHAHHHCHILLKVAGPDRSFIVGGHVLPMRDDTAILVNAWERHRYVHPPSAERTVFLALYIEPSWIAQLERSFARFDQAGFFHEACAIIGRDIRGLAERLSLSLELVSHASPADVKQLISEIVLSIMHRHAEWPGRRFATAHPRLQDYRIRRALRIMRDQPAIPPDLDALAQLMGLSRPRFNQLFRLCTGISPALYGNALRVERGVKNLSSQRPSIAAVSDQLGFTTQGNFSRFFSQHTGITPSSFSRMVNMLDEQPPDDP